MAIQVSTIFWLAIGKVWRQSKSNDDLCELSVALLLGEV